MRGKTMQTARRWPRGRWPFETDTQRESGAGLGRSRESTCRGAKTDLAQVSSQPQTSGPRQVAELLQASIFPSVKWRQSLTYETKLNTRGRIQHISTFILDNASKLLVKFLSQITSRWV